MWAATLVAEELLDRLQREGMNDERLQPLTRMIARIHVIEEARHVRFARKELVREMEQAHQGPVSNTAHHDTKAWMAEKIVPFLDEVGMINPLARLIYRRAHLME